MFSGIAYAADPAATPAAGNPLFLMAILFAVFYFLLIRPQQKKAKQHQTTLEALVPGDTIITNGGIYGTIVKIDGHVVTIQCSDKVRLKIIKKAISAKVDPETMEGE